MFSADPLLCYLIKKIHPQSIYSELLILQSGPSTHYNVYSYDITAYMLDYTVHRFNYTVHSLDSHYRLSGEALQWRPHRQNKRLVVSSHDQFNL